jgi:aminoglycoside phosphotransferase (APT) family kinase protein
LLQPQKTARTRTRRAPRQRTTPRRQQKKQKKTKRMVTATEGVLLQCDVPTKEYLLQLNSKQAQNQRFVLRDLDEAHLWIKPGRADFVQQAVREFNNLNVYTAPSREELGAAAAAAEEAAAGRAGKAGRR